jgi:dihydrofolate reductase
MNVKVDMIMAMDLNQGIGLGNQLPWPSIKEDMDFFKTVTMNKTVIMGRKTFESIGKPLPGRINVVLTRDLDYRPPGVWVYNSPHELMKNLVGDDVVVIGGKNIYQIFMPHVRDLYVTFIHNEYLCDTHMDIDFTQWDCVWEKIDVASSTGDGIVFTKQRRKLK